MPSGSALYRITNDSCCYSPSPVSFRPMKQQYLLAFAAILLLALSSECRQTERRVLLAVDGERRWVTTEAATVGAVLEEAGVRLGELDRVQPPAYTPLEAEMLIEVIRVREQRVTEERTVPYERQIRRDATLPRGESRVVQLGRNGTERLTWRVRYENGVEVARELETREQTATPRPEIMVVGTLGSVETIPITGTLVYLAAGNAWVMQDSNTPRALTRTGDLDGHVFALSPDSRWLLFTRTPIGGSAGQAGPLNSLWIVRTDIVDDEPTNLGVESALWADWRPCTEDDGCLIDVGYSTAQRTPSPPGWKARNDFWLITLSDRGEPVAPRRVKAPVGAEWYAWWGRVWSWSPDGRSVAWGSATNLGVLDVKEGKATALTTFVPYETLGPWVWTPHPAWRPDGRWIAAVVHAPPAADERPERSERFDLWLLPASPPAVAGVRTAPPVQHTADVGMWAMPAWSTDGRLAYLQTEDPGGSATSRYVVMLSDADGSNRRRLFPAAGTPGLEIPRITWSPDDRHLALIWRGDLYRLGTDGTATPLTATGTVTQFDWGP